MTTLEQFLETRHSGYAYDLVTSILEGNGTESDADTLFRTLVMDESMSVEVATELFEDAKFYIST